MHRNADSQLRECRNALETYSEFDMRRVAAIIDQLYRIVGPTHRRILDAFLTSEEVYEPDRTRQKAIEVIDGYLRLGPAERMRDELEGE